VTKLKRFDLGSSYVNGNKGDDSDDGDVGDDADVDEVEESSQADDGSMQNVEVSGHSSRECED